MSLPSWGTRMQAVAGQIPGFKPRAPATQEREAECRIVARTDWTQPRDLCTFRAAYRP